MIDLKRELKTRGLSTAGNKDELVERLNTYTQNLLGSGSGNKIWKKSRSDYHIPVVLNLFTNKNITYFVAYYSCSNLFVLFFRYRWIW